jgi:hypothetical protein
VSDYVSELRPPTGLLFVSQVIYEHGELRWNDIDRETSDLFTRALRQFCQHHVTAKQKELTKEMINFIL